MNRCTKLIQLLVAWPGSLFPTGHYSDTSFYLPNKALLVSWTLVLFFKWIRTSGSLQRGQSHQHTEKGSWEGQGCYLKINKFNLKPHYKVFPFEKKSSPPKGVFSGFQHKWMISWMTKSKLKRPTLRVNQLLAIYYKNDMSVLSSMQKLINSLTTGHHCYP